MNYESNYTDEYATKDLYFAAFLSVKGIAIRKVEKYGDHNGTVTVPTRKINNPAYFIFENRDRCEELEGIFWSGDGSDAMVNVKAYTTTLRDLRTRAFSISAIVRNMERNYEGN